MAETMDVYFATNRDFDGNLQNPKFGGRFNADGPQFFRVGEAKVERRGDDDYAYQSATVGDENLNANETGSRKLFGELCAKLKGERQDILIFIHGFGNTFENSLERGAQLRHEYTITTRSEAADVPVQVSPPVVFVFSWPSDGEVFPTYEYRNDRDDAQASGVAMARALVKLLKFLTSLRRKEDEARRELGLSRADPLPEDRQVSCDQRIHLVAHSMGNWALRHAVNRFAEEVGLRPLPRIFDHVFLMAADEDDDTFEDPMKLALLPDLAKFVHVYHSQGDRALDISDITKGNPNRLGEGGPRNMDVISDRVYAVNCLKVDFTLGVGHLNHQYYRLRREVIDDVRQVLSDTPFDRITRRVLTSRSRSYRILGADEPDQR